MSQCCLRSSRQRRPCQIFRWAHVMSEKKTDKTDQLDKATAAKNGKDTQSPKAAKDDKDTQSQVAKDDKNTRSQAAKEDKDTQSAKAAKDDKDTQSPKAAKDGKDTQSAKASQDSKKVSSDKPTATSVPPAPQTARKNKTTLPLIAAAIFVVVVLVAALWYVQQAQQKFTEQFGQQLQSQLSSSQQSSQQISRLSQQFDSSQRQLKQASDKIALLEEQVGDLSQALQVMTDSGTELMLLNDVAHFIDLAQQQLLVGGNVRNAIIPLETAQARLVRSNRQSLAILLQAINGDLDRLRAVDSVDVPDTLEQLETLLTWLTEAPLLAPQEHQLEILETHDDSTAADRAAPQDTDQEWWEESIDVAQHWAQRAWNTMRAELAELVSVRRVDDATVLLMTPEQIQGLREHIRLRVSMAQLALMTRQNEIWQMELDTLTQLVEKRFDLSNAKTQRALGLLRELQGVDVQPKLPSLDNTLAAVENLRQKAAQQADEAEQHELEQVGVDATSAPADEPTDTHQAQSQDEDKSSEDNKS